MKKTSSTKPAPKNPTAKKAVAKKSVAPKIKLSLTQQIIAALEDLKGQDIVCLDVTGLTDVTDYMIVASGTSNRQVRALAEHVMETLNKSKIKPLGFEGLDGGEWALVDFGDAIVHVMLPETRLFYDLERLWHTREPKPAVSDAKTEKTVTTKKAAAKTSHKTPEKKSSIGKKSSPKKTGARNTASKSSSAKTSSAKTSRAKTSTVKNTNPAKAAAKTASKTTSRTATAKTSRATGMQSSAKKAPAKTGKPSGKPARKP